MRAMVSDYGFPPASGVRFDSSSSSNVILLAYCDPEFLFTFRLTEKSDVYSFGVVLVELLTGRPPLMGDSDCFDYVTTEWAKTMFEQGRGSVILDPHIPRIPATMIVMEKVLALAVLCLNREGKNRPTMAFCAEALEQISEEYTLLLFGPHDQNR
ncbi:Leucine-rich receptor-like protein kinase family protein [Rhynchospora pubera]|uniref:Leucine-rich receptor-like protein kinase family protein n=1 Tax=Rhynchospora pubera TaxID=906938 RepID=A0AAV8AGH6_9POAL|nr:Leucine-rich receptor-like protein kinase family protein [Rhynchospora pubera]